MYTLLYQKQGEKSVLSHIKLLFTWLNTSSFFPVLTAICKLSQEKHRLWLCGDQSWPWGLRNFYLVHAIHNITFLPGSFCTSYSMNPIPMLFPPSQNEKLVMVKKVLPLVGWGAVRAILLNMHAKETQVNTIDFFKGKKGLGSVWKRFCHLSTIYKPTQFRLKGNHISFRWKLSTVTEQT